MRKTVVLFDKLMKYLFIIPDVTIFLSTKLCQDPLEKFLACRGKREKLHDNPSVTELL